MNYRNICVSAFLLVNICLTNTYSQDKKEVIPTEYIANADHAIPRMRFKVVESQINSPVALTKKFAKEIAQLTEDRYLQLTHLILEKDIPTIQKSIAKGALSYRELALFYLYRIDKFEGDPQLRLNAIISLNPDILQEAEEKDKESKKKGKRHLIFGMPILLKDNIGYNHLPTTAGAAVLSNNYTKDAYIVSQLKKNGALILGKSNLSEWAYFFCSGCPLGYSAVGGQTLNPYARMKIETGGSSSGSGVATAANYAIATVGSETSGSILSPSSLNSIVGLKPTPGLLSRSGIVPISSTLDTPGPMTKNVTDNAILLDAMKGIDTSDDTYPIAPQAEYISQLTKEKLKDKKFGVFKHLLETPNYATMIEKLKKAGASVYIIENNAPQLQGFTTLLNMDMKKDLPAYLNSYAGADIQVKNIGDIITYNKENPSLKAPYGQGLFEGILSDTTQDESFLKLKSALHETGKNYLGDLIKNQKLDAI
ncbi:MAG: amidase family protein, partial [Saprospiraceae bacterium]